MKYAFFAFALFFYASCVKAQTTPKPEKVVELKGNILLTEDFIYQDSNYVYFQKDDAYYKISQSKVESTTGIATIPTTTYYEDMYGFTKKGLNAMTLYILGAITTTGGYVIAFKTESVNLGIGFLVLGTAISFSGLLTEVSAWQTGKKANIKMVATEY